ncbi:hypothetical protein HNR46_003113 [Haloferula luteola]|uniref:Uncharacterized protein n=1 Tax=Haloferula luteola TaxID=595692 RepID=A0A840VBE2_9BACT|nr:hypothetical protein [Haloferula luteola]
MLLPAQSSSELEFTSTPGRKTRGDAFKIISHQIPALFLTSPPDEGVLSFHRAQVAEECQLLLPRWDSSASSEK